MRGWIAYGDSNGIWAVNPTRPDGSPSDPIQLSDRAGEPFGWSRDGSQLLIGRFIPLEGTGLFLLNANGTETRVQQPTGLMLFGASLSPDGSQIAYARIRPSADYSGIYVVASEGGSPRLIRPGRRQWYSDEKDYFPTGGVQSDVLARWEEDRVRRRHGRLGQRPARHERRRQPRSQRWRGPLRRPRAAPGLVARWVAPCLRHRSRHLGDGRRRLRAQEGRTTRMETDLVTGWFAHRVRRILERSIMETTSDRGRGRKPHTGVHLLRLRLLEPS